MIHTRRYINKAKHAPKISDSLKPLDGYEVEKEPLYTVEIPNPNFNAPTILQKQGDKTVMVVAKNARWRGWSDSKLTEAEIKQDFEWAFQFAKPVEE